MNIENAQSQELETQEPIVKEPVRQLVPPQEVFEAQEKLESDYREQIKRMNQ